MEVSGDLMNDLMLGCSHEDDSCNHQHAALDPPFGQHDIVHSKDNVDDREETSPTSIIPVNNKDRFRSTVAMCETGAEVTLDVSALRSLSETTLFDEALQPPTQSFPSPSKLPQNALFDATPSPAPSRRSQNRSGDSQQEPKTPQNVALCGLSICCQAHETRLEQQILQFLSNPLRAEDWCQSWHNWSYFRMETNRSHTPEPHVVKNVLRKRVQDLNARRERLATLRKDLSPFTAENTPTFSRSHSFHSMHHAPPSLNRISRNTNNANMKRHVPPSSKQRLSTVFQCGSLVCTLDEQQPMTFVVENGYDSDPEDFARTKYVRVPKSSHARSHTPIDVNDEMAVCWAVQGIMNETLTLIWHGENSLPIHFWIERGQMLRNLVIPPKLCWTRKLTPFSSTTPKMHHVDLLDVHRILNVATLVDRSKHPFAKNSHCFFIKTIHDSFTFEASSVSERDRIVLSLKLVISRLASMLIISDLAMVDEFFLTMDGKGPGEEPLINFRHNF